jgi:hypothetical protein
VILESPDEIACWFIDTRSGVSVTRWPHCDNEAHIVLSHIGAILYLVAPYPYKLGLSCHKDCRFGGRMRQ